MRILNLVDNIIWILFLLNNLQVKLFLLQFEFRLNLNFAFIEGVIQILDVFFYSLVYFFHGDFVIVGVY